MDASNESCDTANDPAAASCDDLASQLRLSLVSGVGPLLRKALLARFGNAANVFSAAPADVRAVPGIGAELTRRIVAAKEDVDVEEELRLCADNGITILSEEHP